jgi:hypothetical protein
MNITFSAETISLLVVVFFAGIALGALAAIVGKRWSGRIGWWPPIVALAFLAIALFLIPSEFERLALFALVAVTMAYAIFTYQQVQASKQMIGEAKEQRLARLQPIIMLKSTRQPMAGMPLRSGLLSEHFSHFVAWNAGSGPAVELEIALLRDNLNLIEAHRETFLRSGEEYTFKPQTKLYLQAEGKYYVVCQYKRALYPTEEEVWDQTWLPFNLSKASKEGEVYVAPGELDFRFGLSKKDKVEAFTSKPK